MCPRFERAVEEVAGIRDPGERECASSQILPTSLLDLPDELVSESLDIVGGFPHGPELLAGMAVAAPTRIAVGARIRLHELEHAPAPLGRLVVEQAWEMDAAEPVVALFALCAREGAAGSQLFSFTIEQPLSGGAIKDGFVTGTSEGRRLAKKLTGRLPEEVELRSLDAEEAASRIVAAARQGAASGLAPTSDGLTAATVFLRASGADDADAVVQALELGESLAERVEELEAEAAAEAVDGLAAAAEAWFAVQGLAPDATQAGGFATGLMGDFRLHYLGGDLTGWTKEDLDLFLLDWVPRKVSLLAEEIDGFPQAVADALRFLGESGKLPARTAEALAGRTMRHAARFASAMSDPSLAGPAKSIFAAMSAEGVEIGNPEAMQTWLDDFNARPLEERDLLLGPTLPLAPTGKSPARTKARKSQKQARRRNRGR